MIPASAPPTVISATLLRYFRPESPIYDRSQGTEGELIVYTTLPAMPSSPIFRCKTMELPWNGNQQNISCIPAGEYRCERIYSPRFGHTYEITNVPGRTHILFHTGNFAGYRIDSTNTTPGTNMLRTDSSGCVLLGKYHGTIDQQATVMVSRATVRRFLEVMNKRPFTLMIMNQIKPNLILNA